MSPADLAALANLFTRLCFRFTVELFLYYLFIINIATLNPNCFIRLLVDVAIARVCDREDIQRVVDREDILPVGDRECTV